MSDNPLRIHMIAQTDNCISQATSIIEQTGYAVHTIITGGIDSDTDVPPASRADIIICNDFRGLRALLSEMSASAPVIVLAPGITHERGLQLVQAGAHDYLDSNALERLPAAITSALRSRAGNTAAHGKTHLSAFAELYRHTLEAVAITDRDERVVDINGAFTKLFDFPREAICGRKLNDCIMPEDKKEESRSLRSRVQGGKMVRKRTSRIRRSGEPVEVIAIGIPVTLPDGEPGMCAIYSDISPREKAIRALRQAESRYRRFFMKAVEGMYMSTPGGRYILANPALADLLGYSSISEVTDDIRNIGREVYADPAERDALLRQVRENGFVQDFRATVMRSDGSTIAVRQNVREIRDEDGELLYYQGTMAPVTEAQHTALA